MRRSPPGWAVPALAGTLGLWLVVDVVRQNQLGVADAGLWFVAAAGVVALTAATIVGRWPELRRMALLILWWLLTALAVDVGVAWPGSRVATTAFLLLLALQAPAYAHMALAYPSGYVRDRLERLFLVVAYTVSLLWELPPALFANGCRNCSPHAPSLLFTGHTFDLAPIGRVFWSLFIALGVGFIALVVRRVLRAPAGARRTLLPLGAAAVLACSQLIVQRVAWLTDWGQAQTMLDWLARRTCWSCRWRSCSARSRFAAPEGRSVIWSSSSGWPGPERSGRRSHARSATRRSSSRCGFLTGSNSSTRTAPR